MKARFTRIHFGTKHFETSVFKWNLKWISHSSITCTIFWPKTLYTPNHSNPKGTKKISTISNFPCHSCFKQSSKRCTWTNWTLLDLPLPSGFVPSLGLLPMIRPLSRQHVFHLPGLLYMVALAPHEGLKGQRRSTLSSPSSRKHLLPRGWMHRVFNLSSIQTHLSMSLVW